MSVTRIRKAAEEADQLIEGLREAAQEPVSNEPPELSAADQGAQPTEVTQEVEAQAAVQAVEGSEGDWQAQAQLWEQRYRSLNGMIQSRDRQIQQLHDLLASMQHVSAAQQAPRPVPDAAESLITKDDEDSYGADLVDMARRAGRQESQQLLNELRAELADLRASVHNVSQVSRVTVQERFEQHLDKLTNGRYKTIDTDPAFIAWLEKSPARHRVFAEGVQGRDASTVAEFFNDYARLAQIAQTEAAAPGQARASELERQLAPGKSKAGAAPISQAGDKKSWTRTEIAQLYANKRKYGADEFNKLEREVAAAQREGRVDFNK